ncbi:hypothetical protein BDR22DRAFT_972871 [Usnea florida]
MAGNTDTQKTTTNTKTTTTLSKYDVHLIKTYFRLNGLFIDDEDALERHPTIMAKAKASVGRDRQSVMDDEKWDILRQKIGHYKDINELTFLVNVWLELIPDTRKSPRQSREELHSSNISHASAELHRRSASYRHEYCYSADLLHAAFTIAMLSSLSRSPSMEGNSQQSYSQWSLFLGHSTNHQTGSPLCLTTGEPTLLPGLPDMKMTKQNLTLLIPVSSHSSQWTEKRPRLRWLEKALSQELGIPHFLSTKLLQEAYDFDLGILGSKAPVGASSTAGIAYPPPSSLLTSSLLISATSSSRSCQRSAVAITFTSHPYKPFDPPLKTVSVATRRSRENKIQHGIKRCPQRQDYASANRRWFVPLSYSQQHWALAVPDVDHASSGQWSKRLEMASFSRVGWIRTLLASADPRLGVEETQTRAARAAAEGAKEKAVLSTLRTTLGLKHL